MAQTAAGALGNQLGQILFGRPDSGQALAQGQAAGALVSDRMASARRSRAQALIDEDQYGARQGITPDALKTAGYQPDQAALLGSILRANASPNLTQLGQLQLPTTGQALNDARDAFKLGDVARGNTELALAQGKPIETTKVADGQVFNPYGDSGQNVPLTALGQAIAGDKSASARAHDASAAASFASAARQRAGIGADRASNYELVDTGSGLVRVNKLDPTDVRPVLMDGGAPVKKVSAGASGATTITNPDGSTTIIPGGKPNTQELTNAGFYSRMVEANKILDGLEAGNYDPTNARDMASQHVPLGNVAMSQTGQKYQQAAMNWIRANLRKESGAAIGKDEAAQEYANYFPKYGDGPEVIAQKAANRRNVEKAMRIAAGPAASLVMGSASGSDIAAGTAAPATPESGAYHVGQIIMHGGKPYRVTGGDPNDPDVEPVQ